MITIEHLEILFDAERAARRGGVRASCSREHIGAPRATSAERARPTQRRPPSDRSLDRGASW